MGFESFPPMNDPANQEAAEEKQRVEDVAAANADMKDKSRLDSFPQAAEAASREALEGTKTERTMKYEELNKKRDALSEEMHKLPSGTAGYHDMRMLQDQINLIDQQINELFDTNKERR